MNAQASAVSHYDLRTVAGRLAYLTALAEWAVGAGKLTIGYKAWSGRRAARLYVADYWISVDDEGDLVGGGKCKRSDLQGWVDHEDEITATFDVGPLASTSSHLPATRRRACHECRAPIRAWSDGASRGLCHDCA